jgi:hypothetical protein
MNSDPIERAKEIIEEFKHYGPGPHKGTGTPQSIHSRAGRDIAAATAKDSPGGILRTLIGGGLKYRDSDGNYLTGEVKRAVKREAKKRGLPDPEEISLEAVGLLGAGPFK